MLPELAKRGRDNIKAGSESHILASHADNNLKAGHSAKKVRYQ